MLNDMIIGDPITITRPTKTHLRYMKRLIYSQIDSTTFKKKLIQKVTIPFITRLFHHFSINVVKVLFNLKLCDVSSEYDPQFGYKIFQSIFSSNNKPFNPQILLQLFVNLEEIVVFSQINPMTGYEPSVALNNEFVSNVMESINILNHRSLTAPLKLKHFIIVNPKSRINIFINENQDTFKSLNWFLSQQTYKDNASGNCDECLFISCLKNS